LHLDERQRAMLAEMHIRVWAPRSEAIAAPSATATEATAPNSALATPRLTQAADPSAATHASMPLMAARPPVVPPDSAPAPSLAQADGTRLRDQRERVANLGWGELKAAVQQCQACALGATRSQAVWGQGAVDPDRREDDPMLAATGLGVAQADWLVVVAAPTAEDQAQGLPMVGDAGRLLDNILRASGLQREGLGPLGHSVFITSAVKCAPPQERNPQAVELDMCEPQLARQIALLRPKVIVAMGLVAAQSVLRQDAERIAGLPLGRLRQQVWQHQGTPVVVTYPSAYLMRTPADKAKAWADWCMARTLALGKAG
jgi:DNA polymerase